MDLRNISPSSPPFGPSSRNRRASLGNEKERIVLESKRERKALESKSERIVLESKSERIALESKRERIVLESKREREEIVFEKRRIGKKRPFLPDPSPCEEKRRKGEEEGQQRREEEWLKRGKVERAKVGRKGREEAVKEEAAKEERVEVSRKEDYCHSMKDQEQEERTRVPSPGVVLVDEVVQVGASSGSGGKRVSTMERMGRKGRKRSGSTNSSSSVFTPTIPYHHPYHHIHHSPAHRPSDGNGIQVPQFLDPFRDVHQWYHPFASSFSADCSSPPPGSLFAKRSKMGGSKMGGSKIGGNKIGGSKGRKQQEGVHRLPEDGRREGSVHVGGMGSEEEAVASALRRFPSTDFTLTYEPLSLSVGRMSPLNLNLSPSIPGASGPGSELSPRTSILDNYEALLNLAERLGQAKSKGLPKEEINQLPSYRCTSTHSLDSDQSSCVVCMNDFNETQMVRMFFLLRRE